MIPMIGALGLATDTARGFLLKARLSQAIDQAVLAGGKEAYFSSTRNDDVLKYFAANLPQFRLDQLQYTVRCRFHGREGDARLARRRRYAGQRNAAPGGNCYGSHNLHARAERFRMHDLR